jgi:hypothetical protein
MATIWKSTDTRTENTISGTILSSWSRQQKLAMLAAFAILGFLLALSACSKQSSKTALVSVSSPVPTLPAPTTATPATAPAAAPTATKKTSKKRPVNVTYNDANSGISFLYPRKFALTSGDKAQHQLGAADRAPDDLLINDVPMNFVQPGGLTVATVALPGSSYPGTDFASAFFNVNINRSVSEQECEHFAFVDTRNPDGEPVDAEKVKVGLTDMEMTSNFSASMMKQAETEYYHSYENGACYEYVLGLGTAGYGSKDGIEPVDRDEVFARLEKILTTVKVETNAEVKKTDEAKTNDEINPVEDQPVAEQTTASITGGK